jgi:hypothetical protein
MKSVILYHVQLRITVYCLSTKQTRPIQLHTTYSSQKGLIHILGIRWVDWKIKLE